MRSLPIYPGRSAIFLSLVQLEGKAMHSLKIFAKQNLEISLPSIPNSSLSVFDTP